ncbi:hypothetical protein DRO69_10455 [Candidatus Bathyarchaeota archaeon]|nr:MAG: hypothetical protein DRO69_10455 [Candidatus Bathyarchaeota archaeon]
MPSVEKHVEYCVKNFGRENEALCYQVNSWMDAPSRDVGSRHRIFRHDLERTILMAIIEFLSKEEYEKFLSHFEGLKDGEKRVVEFHTPKFKEGKLEKTEEEKWKNKAGLIANIVIQHLMLDGLLTQRDLDTIMHKGLNLNVNMILKEIKEEQRKIRLQTQTKFFGSGTITITVLSLLCGFICSTILFGSMGLFEIGIVSIVPLFLVTVLLSLPFVFLFVLIFPILSKGTQKKANK